MNEEWACHLGIAWIPPPRPVSHQTTHQNHPPTHTSYAHIRITFWDNTVLASSFSSSALDFVGPWLCQWRWIHHALGLCQNQWHQAFYGQDFSIFVHNCSWFHQMYKEQIFIYLYWSWRFEERKVCTAFTLTRVIFSFNSSSYGSRDYLWPISLVTCTLFDVVSLYSSHFCFIFALLRPVVWVFEKYSLKKHNHTL